MIPENFESWPLTTATVLEFPVIAPPPPVVVYLFYHITCKNSGIYLKKHPVNFPNQLLFVISRCYPLALDKTQETPVILAGVS
jgi:hypothetical protein